MVFFLAQVSSYTYKIAFFHDIQVKSDIFIVFSLYPIFLGLGSVGFNHVLTLYDSVTVSLVSSVTASMEE